MSGPLEDRLSQFTPAAGFDRDGLLFATGRASARPHRGWIALAGILALTQALTLVLLWPRPVAPLPLPLPEPAVQPDLPAPAPSESAPQGPLVRQPQRPPFDDGPAVILEDLIPDEPPLRISSANAPTFFD